jgi:hypothetical protein
VGSFCVVDYSILGGIFPKNILGRYIILKYHEIFGIAK